MKTTKTLINKFDVEVNARELLDCLSKAPFYTLRTDYYNFSVYHKDTLKGVYLNIRPGGLLDVVSTNMHHLSLMTIKTNNNEESSSSLLLKIPYLGLDGILNKNLNKSVRIVQDGYFVENPHEYFYCVKDNVGEANLYLGSHLIYKIETLRYKYVEYQKFIDKINISLSKNTITVKFNRKKLVSDIKNLSKSRIKIIDENEYYCDRNKITFSLVNKDFIILSGPKRSVELTPEITYKPKNFKLQNVMFSYNAVYLLNFLENYDSEFVLLIFGESKNDPLKLEFEGSPTHTNLVMGMRC